MDWCDETWVKLYRRDTTDWLALSIGARGLFCLILRAVNRAGVLDLGKTGPRAVAVHLRGDWREVEAWLNELLADGCIEVHGSNLVVRNFLAAQEAALSDKARARLHREKVRDEARGVATPENVTRRDGGITDRDETVTGGHDASRCVTRRHEEKEETRRHRSTPNGVLPPQPPDGGATAAKAEGSAKRKARKTDDGPHPPGTPAARIAEAIAKSRPLRELVSYPNALAAAAVDAFPLLDVAAIVAVAGGWCVTNPDKAPTSKGDRFLWGWLVREQNKIAATAASQAQRASAPDLFAPKPAPVARVVRPGDLNADLDEYVRRMK